jgi:hypothetical protein
MHCRPLEQSPAESTRSGKVPTCRPADRGTAVVDAGLAARWPTIRKPGNFPSRKLAWFGAGTRHALLPANSRNRLGACHSTARRRRALSSGQLSYTTHRLRRELTDVKRTIAHHAQTGRAVASASVVAAKRANERRIAVRIERTPLRQTARRGSSVDTRRARSTQPQGHPTRERGAKNPSPASHPHTSLGALMQMLPARTESQEHFSIQRRSRQRNRAWRCIYGVSRLSIAEFAVSPSPGQPAPSCRSHSLGRIKTWSDSGRHVPQDSWSSFAD